jgi:hypothetical protein
MRGARSGRFLSEGYQGYKQGLDISDSGRLIPTHEASGIRGWWRNVKVKRIARRFGYNSENVRYVEEIGSLGNTLRRGGVRNKLTGEILIDSWAFNRRFLRERGLSNYGQVIAHEIGHSFGIPNIRGINATNPEEFWASFYGATLPRMRQKHWMELLGHAYWRYR